MTDVTPVTLAGQPVKIAFAPGDCPPFTLQFFLNPQEFTQGLLWQALTHNQLYEPATSLLFARYLRPGDRAVDVGAHVGYYTLLAAALVGETGRVLACELSLPNFQRLSYHLQINGFTQVDPVLGAIGDRCGEISFFVNADNDGGHALWDVGAHPFNQQSAQTPRQATAPMRPLDSLLTAEGPPLRLLKIDTEGAEPLVLAGAQATLARWRPPVVILEVNQFGLAKLGFSQMDVRRPLQELGYTGYVLGPRPQRLATDEVYPAALFDMVFTTDPNF
ncbi:MAG TPA: FkbM family methyltransferase [Cyanobacteria bacterium UBA8156]|nr:FkbM family methyltransferase [Cyanobacteria bacterium UBA8156]